ncbi:hypothetical protein [Bythopirellula polymerisocia]|uniref:Uncharacterized protein n=1 Tax=Bythopirellula polymerisocia TaxID=2528003 RepID=A0A5C6CX00_9BACT|nr:hypothetical protein [Bythopirellula polymerisocia]TWU27546.1 hypothetical protein Pla144_23230 [Bythopirellula polymerisocia]
MNDFYRRLKLKPYTNDLKLIRERILAQASTSHWVEDAFQILLDDKRKRVYDRTHKALMAVSHLRLKQGLYNSPGWKVASAADFQMVRTSSKTPPPPEQNDWSKRARTLERRKLALIILANVGLIALFLYLVLDQNRGPSERSYQNPSKGNVRAEPKNSALALPLTGIIWGDNSFRRSAVAPLKITTSRGANYYVKLVGLQSKQVVATFFIRGGEMLEIEVPLGTFEIRYAMGDQWYGTSDYFGSGTSYSRADAVFEFTKESNHYSGYEIELILQSNGNLETESISEEDF